MRILKAGGGGVETIGRTEMRSFGTVVVMTDLISESKSGAS